jgi:hypothetical protein
VSEWIFGGSEFVGGKGGLGYFFFFCLDAIDGLIDGWMGGWVLSTWRIGLLPFTGG